MKNIDKLCLNHGYRLFESGYILSVEVGSTTGLLQLHHYLFDKLYDFA
nr:MULTISPECIES: hypothetical protein [unclassified Chryseobacterium]